MKPPTAKLPPNYRQCSQPPNRQPPICKGGGGGGCGGGNNRQPTLPGVRDWREPQLVSAQRLAHTITKADSEGFEAVRLESWKRPFGYRVTFQRMADASEVRNATP